MEPFDVGRDEKCLNPALCLRIYWVGLKKTLLSLIHLFISLSFLGSKSQNCLWNSLIDGLTGNVKEKPRPTIVQDTRPPEEILADELPQLDSPEALVKTSFRFGGWESSLFLLNGFESCLSPFGCLLRGQQRTVSLCCINKHRWRIVGMPVGLSGRFPKCCGSFLLVVNWYWRFSAETQDSGVGSLNWVNDAFASKDNDASR